MARNRTRRTQHGHGKRSRGTGELSGCAEASAPLKAAVAPSKAKFDTMVAKDHFTGVSSNGSALKVRKGDDVRIFGVGMVLDPLPATYEYWVGRVCKVKSHSPVRGALQIWLQVQWYYAGPDAASEASCLDTSSLGRYERMLSDAYDIISSLSVAGHATVVDFNEKTLDQPPIPDQAFYSRRNYDSSNKRMNPEPEASCNHCEKPYNPDGPTMIFCPRMGCLKWFHQDCLERQNSWREMELTADDHAIERLRSSPSSDKMFSVSPQKIRSQVKGRAKASSFYEKLEQLEQPLVNCAKQRIARGGSKYGVAGNIKAVLEARSLVYRRLNEDPGAAEAVGGWTQAYKNEEMSEDEDGDAEQESAGPLFICPTCKGAV